jgi:hypothetical protein
MTPAWSVATVSTLAEKAAYVRSEPLTSDEISIHRPDLPFAFGQCAVLSWSTDPPAELGGFSEGWRAATCSEGSVLDASEVFLCPFGSKGGQKPGVRVKATDGAAFAEEER